MKKIILFCMLAFVSITNAQVYQMVDSLKQSNDSLRARIAQLEASAVTMRDTTITIELKNLVENDTLFLYQANRNVHLTSITRCSIVNLGVDEAYFQIKFGNTLFTSGTLLNSQTFLASAAEENNYLLTINNAVTKNQYVWVVCTSLVQTDPEILGTAQILLQLNYSVD